MEDAFSIAEATIGGIQRGFASEELTCRGIVEAYLARIEAYDKNGPAINAIVTINRRAVEEAERLDEAFALNGELVGPLHGIPIVVKDQIETRDLPTAFGSVAMKDYIPKRDASVIGRIRDAGAIILAKTTLPDFATSWFAYSSRSGETKNPYALDRDPGGSSSGTGAAVAANLSTAGLGVDTAGSIRVPASFNCLVGIKVTPGLISRTGVCPVVAFQDCPGPMCRTVTDTAIVLDALVGYDAEDPFTAAYELARVTGRYTEHLDGDGLRGVTIGVFRDGFRRADADAAPVTAATERALGEMESAGAKLVDIEIPDLEHWMELTALSVTCTKYEVNRFLAARPGAPAHSVEEIFQAGQFHPTLELFKAIAQGPSSPLEDPRYFEKVAARESFQRAVVNVMARSGVKALCFPSAQLVPPTREELNAGKWATYTFPTNTFIAARAGMPAMTVPAGFTDDGLPIGLEFAAMPYDEPRLFKVGFAFEQLTRHRRPPASAPEL